MICARLRIICSPAKQGYTARAPTLRPTRPPTRHQGAYSINQNHRTCEEKYGYASAAAAIKRDTPWNDRLCGAGALLSGDLRHRLVFLAQRAHDDGLFFGEP